MLRFLVELVLSCFVFLVGAGFGMYISRKRVFQKFITISLKLMQNQGKLKGMSPVDAAYYALTLTEREFECTDEHQVKKDI